MFHLNVLLYILSRKDDEGKTKDPNEENVQTEVNVEQDDVVVNNVMETDVVVQSGGGGDNVELGGSRTSNNPILINNEECISYGIEFDNDTQDADADDSDDIGGDIELWMFKAISTSVS